MATPATTRLYKTGEEAPQSSNYEFVRYTDGTTTPAPTANERRIYLRRKENFPPIRSTNKGAWWKQTN